LLSFVISNLHSSTTETPSVSGSRLDYDLRFVYLRNRFFSRATEGGLTPDAAAGAGAGTDGIVGGPRTPQQIASQKRLQATQAQVDEVVDIMKTNVEKVLERDQKLSELDDRAGKGSSPRTTGSLP